MMRERPGMIDASPFQRRVLRPREREFVP